MSKLTRYTQQVFGSSAAANTIAQFGSLAASAPLTYSGSTITPAIVQALSNYLTAWQTAVEGGNSPAIEDMNALCYLFAYQLAYLMQEGIAEWDSGTTYYIGSLVNSGGAIYESLTNANLNNALTDGTNWGPPNHPGLMTLRAWPFTNTFTLASGNAVLQQNLTLSGSSEIVVPSSTNLNVVGQLILTGTSVVQATGTGVIRIF